MVLGKLCHVNQWPNQSSYTSNHLIAKRDEYPCHAKQWPTPTSRLLHKWYFSHLWYVSQQILANLLGMLIKFIQEISRNISHGCDNNIRDNNDFTLINIWSVKSLLPSKWEILIMNYSLRVIKVLLWYVEFICKKGTSTLPCKAMAHSNKFFYPAQMVGSGRPHWHSNCRNIFRPIWGCWLIATLKSE